MKSCTQVVCAAVAVVLLSPVVLVAQNWHWRIEPITTEGGKQPSLAVDAGGNLHLSYETDDGRIAYGFRATGQSRWYTMPIGKALGYTEVYTHIAVDKQGNPHICYTPGILQYAYWDGKAWHTQRVSPQTGSIEFSCSIAVATDGTVHLAWYQHGYSDGGTHLRYAFLKDGAWHSVTVDFSPQTGKWNSLLLDTEEIPHLSYDCYTAGEIKFGTWDGKNWISSTADSRTMGNTTSYNRGMGNSLALSSDGNPVISYYEDNALRVAWRRDNRWVLQTVDEIAPLGGWIAYRSSILFDLQGFAHISYETSGALKHAFWDGAKWHIQLLVPTGNEMFRYNTMAIGKDGTLYIVYRDTAGQGLNLAVGTSETKQNAALADSKKKN